MATVPSLVWQEPSLTWKNPLLYHQSQHRPFQSSYVHFKNRTTSFRNKLSVTCSNKNGLLEMKINESPVGVMVKSITRAIKALQKPMAAAVLVGLLLLNDPNCAFAASGGRMGGNSFSSSRSSMSSSRSYTVPRMDRGSAGFSYSTVPFFGPSPFAGVYVGPAVGFGSSAFLIMAAFAAFVLVSGFLPDGSQSSVLSATEKTSVLKLQVGLLGLAKSLQKDLNRIAETADTSTSEGLHYVLTVWLFPTLNLRMLKEGDKWVQHGMALWGTGLAETILALLRHPDYCISAYSSVDVKRSMDEGEKRFNQLSIEERGKFDEETLVNVNNINKQSSTTLRGSGISNEYIVLTILVAAEGVHKVPGINNSRDLKEALQKLASIPSSRTLAVEVLWTPQNEDDKLSERELLEDYPLLRPL